MKKVEDLLIKKHFTLMFESLRGKTYERGDLKVTFTFDKSPGTAEVTLISLQVHKVTPNYDFEKVFDITGISDSSFNKLKELIGKSKDLLPSFYEQRYDFEDDRLSSFFAFKHI